MQTITLSLSVNGQILDRQIQARTSLADFLREDLLLTGTNLGCEHGVCGACTLQIEGTPARSCITLAASCESKKVRTIEDFQNDDTMSD